MGYTVIKSFERGIDTRRMIDTTEAGALLDAVNCHITRGGEIEKRAAFVVIGTFPANTTGMYVTVGEQIHTWGDDATASGPLPPNTTYHSIPHFDGTSTLVKILSVEEFNGKLYVIALYSNGDILHWYDDHLVEVFVPPPPLDPGGGGGGVTPPDGSLMPGMARVSFFLGPYPTTTPPLTGDPVGIMACFMTQPVGWDFSDPSTFLDLIVTDATHPDAGWPYQTTPETIVWDPTYNATAALVMEKINERQAITNVMASVVGNKVTVWVNEVTSEWNNWEIAVLIPVTPPETLYPTDVAGAFATTLLTFQGGVDPVLPGARRDVAVPSAPGDPVPLNNGTFVIAHNRKLYCVQRSTLNFSGNDNAVRWDEYAFGAGSINHTKIGEGTPVLVSLADYAGDLAVFGSRDIFIWHMDPDPTANFKRQVLHRTGTIAPHSTCAFGESEVMYLDRTGIRSLRSRSGVDAAFASDIGNNIDELIVAKIATLTADQLLDNVWADIEPRSGRLWMALYDKIYILSYFQGNRIAAWTIYDASDFPVDMMNSGGDNIYWRSGDSLICYGNTTGDEYDASEVVARFPYIDGGKGATSKAWQGVDIAALGTWQVKASFDPTQPATLDLIANIIKSTYAQEKIAMNGQSPAASLELRSTYVGPARIGNASLHYTDSTAD